MIALTYEGLLIDALAKISVAEIESFEEHLAQEFYALDGRRYARPESREAPAMVPLRPLLRRRPRRGPLPARSHRSRPDAEVERGVVRGAHHGRTNHP
jgi:hypothetical protein